MITLLIKLFVREKDNMDSLAIRQTYGILCSLVGISLNILLFAGKYFTGIISGSIAVTADAFNNLSDAGSSLITLIGFKCSGLKANSMHPFGHGRIEYLSGLAVSVIILLMGLELAKSSVIKILHPKAVENSLLTVIILIVSICVKLYMAYYNRTIGKKINSSAMKAASIDSLCDSAATAIVLFSMLVLWLTNINIDGYSSLLVALFILYAGYNSAKDTLNPLLGRPADPELVKNIHDIVMSHEEIIGIHDLVVHDYGPGRLMVSLHAEVSGNGNIFSLHDAIDRIENELHEKLHCEAVIHMDPLEVNNIRITETKKLLAEKIKELDSEITIHDFRMVTGSTKTTLIFDAVVPFDSKLSDDEARRQMEELVSREFENSTAVIKIDKTYT
ncbi:MAG: cation transporter [Lachnospiraceae bacterium]|nr:cation transporter [Lachnospiraceae bacterium]